MTVGYSIFIRFLGKVWLKLVTSYLFSDDSDLLLVNAWEKFIIFG